jgi:flagellar biosynthesis chaperone FliJ
MRAYSFRLQSVQRVRSIEVARARQRVAALARALAAARSRELELAKSYSSRSTQLGEISARHFLAQQDYERRLAESLAEATSDRQVIEAQLFRARGEAGQAEIREGVLEHLDDRRRNEWITALRHEDALELDDFATLRAALSAVEATREH